MSSVLILPAFGHSPSLLLPWSLGTRVSWPLRNYPRILYFFTRSDLKTIVLPVTVFAYLTAPDTSADHMLYAVFWTWFHLLQFCVSNQSIDPEEDALNKAGVLFLRVLYLLLAHSVYAGSSFRYVLPSLLISKFIGKALPSLYHSERTTSYTSTHIGPCGMSATRGPTPPSTQVPLQ
ncbi:hypothetical protein BJV78DRAFT_1279458 [Lactifluus subvellereus]|nr:hypothetical protein BJV78DRAFT_1279458 [Lactifluus subvellereus]